MSENRIPERDLPQTSPAPTARLRAVQNGQSVLVPLPEVTNAAALVQESIDSITAAGAAGMAQAINETQAEASTVLAGIGYLPPVAYASGINVNNTRITVSHDGEVYAPVADAVPFTTGEIFDPAQWRVIQGVTAADLSASTGADMVGFMQAGSGAELRATRRKLQESVSVLDFIPEVEHAAIRARTTTYDCHAAIMAAIESVSSGSGSYISGPAIYFPNGLYPCGNTIELKRSVRLHGDGSGLPWANTAVIKFPAGVDGIVINRFNTLEGGVEGTPTTAADASIIDGICFQGGGKASGGSHCGVWLRARAHLRNIRVTGFSGNGIQVVATAGAGGGAEGNANNFIIEVGRAENCGGHGLYVDGADVNAGVVTAFDASSNEGWGVYDSSFLGNTYIGCHVDSNALGSYKSDDPNAANIFIGCYSEGGWPPSEIAAPAQVIGGLHGAGFAAGSAQGFYVGDGRFNKWSGGVSFRLDIQGDLANGDILRFGRSDVASGEGWRLKWFSGGDIGLSLFNAYTPLYLTGPDTSFNGGTATAKGAAMLARDLYIGDGGNFNTRRLWLFQTAPTSGEWARGDVIFNTHPSAGGHSGWRCTVGGTAGSTAVFKQFGTIES